MPTLPTVLVAGATMVAPVPNTAALPAAETATGAAQQEVKVPENTIIITARRRNEQAQNVPIAIGVLDGRTINETGAFSVYKLQQLTPTLQIYSSNPRNTAVNIRGIGVPFGLTNDGFEQGVGIYVDDVYYSRPASAVFDFLDVAQVEVLRGPQGTLYGKNTTAGAINIRTNQPTFEREGSVELSVGNYNFIQGKAAISGPLSSTVAARLAVSGTSRRGTIFNVTSDEWIQSQSNLGARAQILFRPQRNLNITLAGDYSTQDPRCCGTVFVGYGPTQRAASRQYPALAAALGYAPASSDPFDRLTDLDASLNAGNKTGGVSLRAVYDVGAHDTLTSITAWRFWDWKPENDRDYTGLDIVSKSQNPSQQNQYSQEFRWGHTGRRLDFVLGAFAFHQRIDTQGTEAQGADSARWNLTGSSASHSEWLDGLSSQNTQFLKATSAALFGQVDFKLTDRLTIQPGARLNYDKKEGFYQRRVFAPDGTEILASNCYPAPTAGTALAAQCGIYSPLLYSPEFSDWNFSYDLTASFRATNRVLLYATYAKTFKTGGINQNGVPVNSQNQPIEAAYAIEPESVHHMEAGAKTQFWGRRATFNVAAFRTVIDNFQANVTNGQYGVLRGYLANAEQARTQGVEVDLSVRPSERFNAYANGALTDAKFTLFTDAPCPPELAGGTVVTAGQEPGPPGVPGSKSPANCDVSGQSLPGVSKWALSYGAEANRPTVLFGLPGEIYFGVDGSYRSRFSSNPSPSIYTWIDGYALTNFRAGFRSDNGLNAYAWLRNAFDTKYFEQLNFGPSNTGLIAGSLGEPRTFGATVSKRF
jgi:iron complex outermembrane receptor protein